MLKINSFCYRFHNIVLTHRTSAIAEIDYTKITVTIDDVMANGHCARGTRRWFERYGLDFRSFLKNGIPADQFLATNDGLAIAIVKRKLEREA
jgi:hypothetical protein